MNTISSSTIINSVIDLLTEAYSGPPIPAASWFLENEPDSGIFSLLDTVSASEASISVDESGEPGNIIASHAEHLRWSLATLNSAMRGKDFGNWNESWRVLKLDEAEWDALRQDLRSEFEILQKALQSQSDLPEQYLTGLLSVIPHAAYHLGTIRQMIERVSAKV